MYFRMMSVFLFACLVATIGANCNTGPDRAAKVFKAYDTDRDGKISRIEGIMVFRISDDNSDGLLTRDEFSTEWTFYHVSDLMPFFNVADENDDGRIDFQEATKGFDFFDNDDDDNIDWQEFSKTWDYLIVWFQTQSKNNTSNKTQ